MIIDDLEVRVTMRFRLSLWDAIKIRIAGVRPQVDEMFSLMNEAWLKRNGTSGE